MKRIVVASFVAIVVLTGCTRAIDVAPPDVAPDVQQTCTEFISSLPVTLAGALRAQTQPESPLTAAWGEPYIIVRCGVPTPAAFGPTSQLITVDGVDWFAEELSNGTMFTTIGRDVNIEASVPRDYAPEISVPTELSSYVLAQTNAVP